MSRPIQPQPLTVPSTVLDSIDSTILASVQTNRDNNSEYRPIYSILDLKKEQLKDKKLEEMIKELTKNKYAYENFALCNDGVLYRLRQGNERLDKIVIPSHMKQRILEDFHASPLTAHPGIEKTVQLIKQNFYWPSLYNDTKAYIKACHSCAIMKTPQRHPKAKLGQTPTPIMPFERTHFDIWGPITPVSYSGNKYCLTFTCFLTKYVEVIPLPDVKTETIADMLVRKIILVHSCPHLLISDNGSNLVGEIMQNVCKTLNIKRVNIAPYNAKAQSAIERFHGTLKTTLAHYIQSDPREWDKFVDFAVFAYRCAPHSTIKESPFYALFHRDPNFPFETILRQNKQYYDISTNYAREMALLFKNTLETIRENIEKAREKQAIIYDKKAKEINYEIGDKVYIIDHSIDQGVSKKLRPKYKGPYRIIDKSKTNLTFNVKEIYGKEKVSRVNINDMKPCYDPPIFITKRESGEHLEEEGMKELDDADSDIIPEQSSPSAVLSPDSSVDNSDIDDNDEHESDTEEDTDRDGNDDNGNNQRVVQPHPHHTRSKGPCPPSPWVLRKII